MILHFGFLVSGSHSDFGFLIWGFHPRRLFLWQTRAHLRIFPQTPTQGADMRMIVNVKVPHTSFNAAVKDGTVGSKLNRILESIKPEAVYFTEQSGHRGAILIVDVADASKIPAIAEPWFLAFQADVEFRIAMTPEDLKRSGLEELGKKWA
jgi:hypothetical protein